MRTKFTNAHTKFKKHRRFTNAYKIQKCTQNSEIHTQFRNANNIYKCTQDSEMHRTRFRNVFLMHTQIYLDLQTACGLWTSLHLCVNFETPLTWLDTQMPFFKQGMICNQSDIALVLANHKNAPHVGDKAITWTRSHSAICRWRGREHELARWSWLRPQHGFWQRQGSGKYKSISV